MSRWLAAAIASVAAMTSASVWVPPPSRWARTVAPAFATESAAFWAIALVGVGVAALEDQRDAADERDHRERGDDDDLTPLGPPIAGTRACAAW